MKQLKRMDFYDSMGIMRMMKLARDNEREECARIAEEAYRKIFNQAGSGGAICRYHGRRIAALIRDRK